MFGGGGGGGGSPPKAPKLSQVSTSLSGPLYTSAAATGDEWANLMRGSYGLGQSTGPASWEAKALGPGALALMGQASGEIAHPGTDPQTSGALTTAFGAPSSQFSAGGGGAPIMGGAGGGSSWDLGSSPFQVSANLGQQFKAPLGQLQRGQTFTSALTNQWKAPQTRLTGPDLLNVAFGNAQLSAQGAQNAFAQAVQGAAANTQAQGLASAAGIGALGSLGSAAIKAAESPSLSPQGYFQPGLFASLFGSTGYYTPGSDVSQSLGPALEAAVG